MGGYDKKFSIGGGIDIEWNLCSISAKIKLLECKLASGSWDGGKRNVL